MNERSFVGVALAILGSGIALLGLYVEASGAVLRVMVLISVALLLALVLLKADNLLYLLRTLVLGLVGYFPVIVKAIYGPETGFSPYEFPTQGMDVVLIMYAGTAIALLGSELGLAFGDRRRRARDSTTGLADPNRSRRSASRQVNQSLIPNAEVPIPALDGREKSLWRAAFWVSVPVIIVASVFVANSNGPTILQGGYSGTQNPLAAGSIPAIAVFSLLVAYASIHKVRIRNGRAIVAALTVLLVVWAMLIRGDRNDAVSAILGLVLLSSLLRGRPFALRPRTVVLLGTLAAALFFFGTVRSLDYSELDYEQVRTAITSRGLSNDTVNYGTLSAIATTYSNTVWLVEEEIIDVAWGRSYAEFLLRTPPEFLSQDRPRSYALLARDLGLRTGGGFFELAEAYMNFGLWGSLPVAFLISFLLARAQSSVLVTQGFFSYVVLAGLLAAFVRGAWYQTFAFYRGLTICAVFFVVYMIVAGIMPSRYTHWRSTAVASSTSNP